MRISIKKLVLSFVVMLFLGASASAAPLGSGLAGVIEQAKAEAKTLINQKKWLEAYDLYSRLLREEPDDDEINLGLAKAASLANRPNQAVMAYERLLEKYPTNGSLHREVAHVYAMLGANDLAAQHLALGDMKQGDAQTALTQWTETYERKQIHGRVRTGILFDSNANLGPTSNMLTLGDWNNIRLDHAKGISTMAAYLGAQLDAGYRLDQVSPWWIVGDAQFYGRGNSNDDLDEINSQHSEWGRGAIGVRHLGNKHMLDMRAKAEIFDYGFDQNVAALGPEAVFVYAPYPQVHFISRAGIDKRIYQRDSMHNGWYPYAGEYVRLFFGEAQHSFMLGGRYVGGTANESDYSFDGVEGMASFTFKLPRKIELSPFASYTHEWYNGPATALEPDKREDYRWRAGLGLTIPINNSWSVESSYQYTCNHSNSDLYKYKQNLVSLGLAWSF